MHVGVVGDGGAGTLLAEVLLLSSGRDAAEPRQVLPRQVHAQAVSVSVLHACDSMGNGIRKRREALVVHVASASVDCSQLVRIWGRTVCHVLPTLKSSDATTAEVSAFSPGPTRTDAEIPAEMFVVKTINLAPHLCTVTVVKASL